MHSLYCLDYCKQMHRGHDWALKYLKVCSNGELSYIELTSHLEIIPGENCLIGDCWNRWIVSPWLRKTCHWDFYGSWPSQLNCFPLDKKTNLSLRFCWVMSIPAGSNTDEFVLMLKHSPSLLAWPEHTLDNLWVSMLDSCCKLSVELEITMSFNSPVKQTVSNQGFQSSFLLSRWRMFLMSKV